MRLIVIIAIGCIFSASAPVFADQSLFYKELNLIGGYSDRREWVGKSQDLMNSVGFEYYRKFSNEYGDFLTADLQMRLAYDSSEAWEDAWGLEIHNAWLQYKLNPVHKIKFGHFDPAFGLEQVLDTHSTLLQTLAPKSIGFKKDWGVALEGALPDFDYSAALQLGSGMSIYRKDGSFLATSRIGTPAGRNLQGGLSLLYGKVLEIMGMSTFPRGELLSDKAILKKEWAWTDSIFLGRIFLRQKRLLVKMRIRMYWVIFMKLIIPYLNYRTASCSYSFSPGFMIYTGKVRMILL